MRRGADYFGLALDEPRTAMTAALANWLSRSSDAEMAKVMKVRGALLERAHERAREHVDGVGRWLVAWQRYDGVVWTHLEPSTLTVAQRRRILVPSGLYGLHRGDDSIEDYRLTLNVALPGLGNVANYWRPHVTAALAATRGPLISLLPAEHLGAIDRSHPSLHRRLTHITFVAADGAKAAGHDAKAVKGVLARQLLLNGLDGLPTFSWRGWVAQRRDESWTIRAPSRRHIGGTLT